VAFSLRTIRDNQSKVFSIRKILELLGEEINDEISIDGKAYRISSFLSLDGGGTGQSIIWESLDLIVTKNAQLQFPIGELFGDFINTQLFINGVLYAYGLTESYHIVTNTLWWHGDFDLEISDRVVLKFSKTI